MPDLVAAPGDAGGGMGCPVGRPEAQAVAARRECAVAGGVGGVGGTGGLCGILNLPGRLGDEIRRRGIPELPSSNAFHVVGQ
ncbi:MULTISPECIES: hypothetical protein [unclassified Mycobacterium]|uniref:hypothetical protein n=1 Tax=unclassified Mycobacterium TaxID=2642494 RepID=UPI0027416DD1|nr:MULTISPECIES: hypothetical protein [unclassified Mycobacterium]MDP7706275.1 hypothetical protein [Mycobacterium sp. TY815]MDP7725955.1 hypothetical protein [Mycobacterium sp. TY814]